MSDDQHNGGNGDGHKPWERPRHYKHENHPPDSDPNRPYPRPVPPDPELAKQWRSDIHRQDAAPRPPLRAIKLKGDQLRDAIRYGGKKLDWSDIHDRYVDLWQESRHALWRAKHHKAGVRVWDPKDKQFILTFVTDESLVLKAIDTTKGVLDSIIRLRKEMGHADTGIPRWAIERIEASLRGYPQALKALLADLASEYEKAVDKEDDDE